MKHIVLSYRVCTALGKVDDWLHERGREHCWVCRVYEWAIT